MGELGGERSVEIREEVLAGRTLDDLDEGVRLVVEEDELLSELMDDEGAVDKAAPEWAVAKTDSTGSVEGITVDPALDWAGAVEVPFLSLCRWHSVFQVRREI